MPVITLQESIQAPVEVCFDLSRSIDLHLHTTAHTGEKAVAGVTSGLIGLNEEVTWQAWHLGLRQKLTTRITVFEPPRHFQDTMVQGAFLRMVHDHYFQPLESGGTLMISRFDYTSPLGPLGSLADRLFLKAYLTRFLRTRDDIIKQVAESGEWQHYLQSHPV